MAEQRNSLVTITAKDGASVPVPHIGGHTPLARQLVPHRLARSIEDQGLLVEWHDDDLSREAEHAARSGLAVRSGPAAELGALAPAPRGEPAFAAHYDGSGLLGPPGESGPAPHLPGPVSEEEFLEARASLGEGAAGAAEPGPPGAAPEGPEGAADPERSAALDELKSRAEGLKTIAAAEELVREYGLELGDSPPTTLRGLRQAILDVVEISR